MQRHAERESWFSRNWGWVLGCGCLMPILLIGGCTALFFFGSFGWIQSTGVYGEAMARVRAHPEVIEELGEPIESAWSGASSRFNFRDGGGDAEAELPIEGPRKSGRMRFVAEKRDDGWELLVLEVTIEGRDDPIDVLATGAPPSDDEGADGLTKKNQADSPPSVYSSRSPG